MRIWSCEVAAFAFRSSPIAHALRTTFGVVCAQYQTPFYDGVFCNLDLATFQTLTPQNVASAVGVQGQVFTIVNDESYFYPDLIRGWIVDKVDNMGQGTSAYHPIVSTCSATR